MRTVTFQIENENEGPLSRVSNRFIVSLACCFVLLFAVGVGYIAVTADPTSAMVMEVITE